MTESTANNLQSMRRTNAAAVLGALRGGGVMTATDLIENTGLARATVITVCDDLLRAGWLRELESRRPVHSYQKGRPARRFEFNAGAGCVLGIDVGAGKTTVLVVDLKGRTLAKSATAFARFPMPAAERTEVVNQTALSALEAAGLPAHSVLAVGVGIAATVDRNRNILHDQESWGTFDIGLPKALKEKHGWPVLLENDANLAALAERWCGAAVGIDDLAVILAGERLGAGLIESGRLLHGSRGGAGEMAYLEMLDGVGSTDGIANLARQWGAEAVDKGLITSLQDRAEGSARNITAEMVFQAASDGDTTAVQILDRISARMARVIATLGTIFNPQLVVIGGAVATSASVMLKAIEEELPQLTATPPDVVFSPLGDIIVSLGAARLALDHVEENALDLDLRAAS